VDQSSWSWTRKLTVVVALVVGLLAAALPASAAPTTKNYSASLAFGGATGVQTVTVPSGRSSDVRLVLTNRADSRQSFSAAQLDFTGPSLPTKVSVARPGWTVQASTVASGARYRLIGTGKSAAVRPGHSLEVTVTMPGTPLGTTKVTTQVKQANKLHGTGNDFTVDPATRVQRIVTDGPDGIFCAGTCTPSFTSVINEVRADLTVTSSSPFGYTAGFTTDPLSCDHIPFGPKVTPEPFQVSTDSSAPVTKKLVLTFPKALADLVPKYKTSKHPVCAGGDHPFPGSKSTYGRPEGSFTHPYEGLLLDCSSSAYAKAVAAADPDAFLPMCVKSRSRYGGKLVVTISVAATTVDPRFW
jgi:hypothetical protein